MDYIFILSNKKKFDRISVGELCRELWHVSLTGYNMQARGEEVDSGDQRKPLIKEIPNAARVRLARVYI